MELLAREELSLPQRQRIELIRRAFDMLMGLVNDILDITKIESQSITLASKHCSSTTCWKRAHSCSHRWRWTRDWTSPASPPWRWKRRCWAIRSG
jgi:K+-sensing histidine kinase KdpD